MPRSRWRLAIAAPLAVAFLFPLFWLVSTSLQPTGQPLSRRLDPWPAVPAWENYAAVFGIVEFARFALNSALVVLVAVPLTVLVSSWAGFAMSRLPARPRRALVALSFVVLMTPVTAVWLPRFLLFEGVGLLDSRLALVVPAFAGTSPLFALLFLWSCRRIPPDLFEAASLDGAGVFRLWATVAMPLSRPTTVAVATLAFVAYWGNFVDPLLYVQSIEKQTLPYGLQLLFQLDSTNWPILMAAAAMATLPVVVAFLAAQRWFLQPFRGGGGWDGRQGAPAVRVGGTLGSPTSTAGRGVGLEAPTIDKGAVMTATRRAGRRLWLVGLLLGLVLAPPSLAAAAQDGLAGEVEFAFWGDPAELRAYQSLVEAFEAANPAIDVRIVHVPNSADFYARLATGFAAGSPSDVFLINYRRYGQFAARDVLTAIGPPLQAAGLDLGAYYPEPLAAFTRNGELVCLPQNLSSLVVYYNRDRFEAAGVPLPAPGWGWDDFLSAAKALTEDTDGDGLTDLHGLGVENSLIRFAPFIWQAGGELVDDTDNPTTLTIDTPEARAAIQWFIDLSLVHKVVPTEPEVLALSDEDRFMAGTTAMLLQSRRVVPTLREIDAFVWDVAPLPVGEEAAGILHSDAYCVAAASDNPEAALSFVRWAAGPEGQPIAAQSGRTVPSLVSVAESPSFLGPRGGIATGTEFDRFNPPASARVFTDTVADIRRTPSIATWTEVEEAFDTTLGRAFYGEIPIDEAIALAKARSEDAFRRAAESGG